MATVSSSAREKVKRFYVGVEQLRSQDTVDCARTGRGYMAVGGCGRRPSRTVIASGTRALPSYRSLFTNTIRRFYEFLEILKVPAMRPPQRFFGSRIEEDHLTFNTTTVKRKLYVKSRVFSFLSL